MLKNNVINKVRSKYGKEEGSTLLKLSLTSRKLFHFSAVCHICQIDLFSAFELMLSAVLVYIFWIFLNYRDKSNGRVVKYFASLNVFEQCTFFFMFIFRQKSLKKISEVKQCHLNNSIALFYVGKFSSFFFLTFHKTWNAVSSLVWLSLGTFSRSDILCL